MKKSQYLTFYDRNLGTISDINLLLYLKQRCFILNCMLRTPSYESVFSVLVLKNFPGLYWVNKIYFLFSGLTG